MPDASAVVAGRTELEAVVGTRPRAMMLKSIRFLDEHCERFLACSPLRGARYDDRERIPSGGRAGW
ncbi:MAG TPA: hypothetical protein PKA98_19480 [Acidimicrobiales bacterium]|nr:hypothetical protein [Acidimicrobiales bacterium]